MTNTQPTENDLALLFDLTRLLKKYGPETFKSLAVSLNDPGWRHDLSAVLETVGDSAPLRRSETGKPRRSRNTSERIRGQLDKADPIKAALLQPVVEGLAAGELLPRMKDVTSFALTVGLPEPRAKSRGDAAVSLVRALVAMPVDELEKTVVDIPQRASSEARSLEGWSRIIERSRAETTHRGDPE